MVVLVRNTLTACGLEELTESQFVVKKEKSNVSYIIRPLFSHFVRNLDRLARANQSFDFLSGVNPVWETIVWIYNLTVTISSFSKISRAFFAGRN
jgi:hypothetical protein